MDDLLFSKFDWGGTRDATLQAMRTKIDGIESNRLLNTSVQDLCLFFVQEYRIDVPTLNKSAITVDQRETRIDVSADPLRHVVDRSRPFYIDGTMIEVELPFTGDASMFHVKPSTYTLNPPRAKLLRRSALRIHIVGADLDSNSVKSTIEQTIGSIEQYLNWQRNDVAQYNTQLPELVESHLERRRNKLLQDQNLVASLGYALRARKNTPKTFSTPKVRRRVTPILPTSKAKAFKPEPALSDQQFEHIISVISNLSIVMERSPAAFAAMKEEALRSHILVQLNGHYEGNATGETFNFDGKTDILIRVEGKNIFIAECKFWKGPKALADTIDQLLGYASWRDTKVAIVLFNRQKDFTRVLKAIPVAIEGHPNYKRQSKGGSDTDFRYVLGHRDDTNRELTLAVVAFEVPSGGASDA